MLNALCLASSLLCGCGAAFAGPPAETVSYSIRFPAPDKHEAEVEARFPTARGNTELFMPIWSPGFYRVEDYAAQVHDLAARSSDGASLTVEHPKSNRWLIRNTPAASIVVTYRLHCENAFVTTNWVGEAFGILNGPATFITLVGGEKRPYEVTLSLPPGWERIATGLEPADGAHRFRAPDYEHLLDCPIAAGKFDVRDFDCEGSRHEIFSLGELGEWNPARPPADLAKIAAENRRLWGDLPFQHYVFLLNIRPGGGGLEHLNSTLITTGPNSMKDDGHYKGWLSLASHEYFHAFNVKRLRPVELGPFDYENPPRTPSLWISEGLTSYYGDLILCRAGLVKPEGYLHSLSSHISQLQHTPGRLLQSLEQSSLNVWTNSRSGVQTDDKTTVSYYVKGPVAGFLLDARVRKATGGAKSLDDVMRLAMARYSGARGFTPEQFIATASQVAGADLKDWYAKCIATAGELDYSEALEWFGLHFEKDADGRAEGKESWNLALRPDASQAQRSHLREWLQADLPAPK